MQLLQREEDEEKSTQNDASEFVKKLLETNKADDVLPDFNKTLLLSASDLLALVQDKKGYLKKQAELEAHIAKIEHEYNTLKQEL